MIRSKGQEYTVGQGAADFDGRRARTTEQIEALDKYANVFRDYCHVGDPMCAVGSSPEDVYVHLNYFEEHNEEVVQWVSDMSKSIGKVSNGPSKPDTAQNDATSTTVEGATGTDSPKSSPSKSTSDANDTNSAGSLAAKGGLVSAVAILSVVFAIL